SNLTFSPPLWRLRGQHEENGRKDQGTDRESDNCFSLVFHGTGASFEKGVNAFSDRCWECAQADYSGGLVKAPIDRSPCGTMCVIVTGPVKLASPETSSVACGSEVPIPVRPSFNTVTALRRSFHAVPFPITKR